MFESDVHWLADLNDDEMIVVVECVLITSLTLRETNIAPENAQLEY